MNQVLPAAGSAQLWYIALDDPAWDQHEQVLDQHERQRAAAFLLAHVRRRFMRGHAALRVILGHRLERAPQDVALLKGAFGKPFIQGSTLQFSFSHSHDRALLALSSSAIGVDLEWDGAPLSSLDAMIDLVCHANEKQTLHGLPVERRQHALYAIWTRKEAYVKALGVGLQRPLTPMYIGPDGRVHDEVHDAAAAAAASPWHVRSWRLAPAWQVSLASEHAELQVAWFDAAAGLREFS